jgi:aryl-alcohol dehydrogenase-like predicted oxidoreductase
MSINQQYRNLGKTELKLSPIGLGTWQFSKRKNLAGKFWPILSDEESFEVVKTSYENGVNWFDTAELYGNGESERTLAGALKDAGINNEDVVVATKWSPIFRTASSILGTIDERLKALEGYSISLHQIHNPMSFSSIKKEMQAMSKLAKEKKIKYIGVSNFSASQMRKAHNELSKHGLVLASNQVHYNLLNRKIEYNGVLQTAKELGIAIIAYSPLAQGVLTGKFHENPDSLKSQQGFRKRMPSFKKKSLEKTLPLIDKLKEIALKHKATPAQIALSWLVNFHGNHVFAIPGASNTKQAKSNALSMNINLSNDELKTIEEISTIVR